MTDQVTLLQKLAQPFPPEHITWKPGHTTKDGGKCMAMAYADLRAYQERLDELCGLEWSVRYLPWSDGRIICELTICGVTRASTGEMDAQDEKNGMGGTVAEAQAMKRAAAQFGLGRYLYDLPSVWVEFDTQRKRISENGQAELDRRYKEWYARKTPRQNAPQATQKPVDASEGTPPHQRMWGQGASAFGADWNMARPWLIRNWTEKVAGSAVRESATDLNDDEKDMLADYIKANLKKLQQSWTSHKAALAQSDKVPA